MRIITRPINYARRAGLWRLIVVGYNHGRLWLYRLLPGVRFCQKQVHGYQLLLDLKDTGISSELFTRGDREEEHHYILGKELKPGMTVLDLGANIGYYSIMMGRLVGAQGKIYAVEPSVDNCDLLCKNIALNGLESVVEVFNLGMSNTVGVGRMYLSEMSNRHTFYPYEHAMNGAQTMTIAPSVEVPVSTISTFVEGKRPIDLIRMDIEGYEVEVLEGLTPALADDAFRAKILFETHRERYDDLHHDIRPVLNQLFRRGYYVKWLVANSYYGKRAYEVYHEKGYSDRDLVATFRICDRAIYENIADNDALEFICNTEFVRAVLLERAV